MHAMDGSLDVIARDDAFGASTTFSLLGADLEDGIRVQRAFTELARTI